MDFRTNLPVSQAPFTLTHAHRLFVMGSCFAEQTGQRLRESGFRTVVNPFGVLYNPVSIEQAINRLLAHKTYEADELVVHEGLYQSFDHHGSFSNVHAEKALADINHAFRNAVEGLETADCLILTLGTAWLYKRVDTNKVVANCHKWPATFFIQKANEFRSTIWVEKEERRVNAKSLLGELSLGIIGGSNIRIVADGSDENEAVNALVALLESGLEEN